jgi:hypothetical protein
MTRFVFWRDYFDYKVNDILEKERSKAEIKLDIYINGDKIYHFKCFHGVPCRFHEARECLTFSSLNFPSPTQYLAHGKYLLIKKNNYQ